MRLTLALIAALAVAACSAPDSPSKPPAKVAPAALLQPGDIPNGAPYPVARTALIAAGYEPARLVKVGLACGGTEAPCKDEKILCATDVDYCEWLFVRRRDEALFIAATDGYAPGGAHAYVGLRPAERHELETMDLVVALPSGRRLAFSTPPPPYVEPETPPCSETNGKMPCWIKPPPGEPTEAATRGAAS